MLKEDMFFCTRCKNFSKQNSCDYCGKRKIRLAEQNDPIYLTTKTTIYAGMLEEALKRNDIPHYKLEKHGGMLKYMGLSLGIEEFDFFVPLGAKQQAQDLLKELFSDLKCIKLAKTCKFKGTKRVNNSKKEI